MVTILALRQSSSPSNFKLKRLKDTSRHAFQATNSCAIAYSYARIRRLVRLGGGFYCGAVADESAIGSRSPSISGRTTPAVFMAAVRGRPSGLPVLESRSATRV